MKTLWKVCLVLCLAVMFVLTGCGKEEYGLVEKDGKLTLLLPGDDGTVELSVRRMEEAELAGYTILRPDTTDGITIDAAQLLSNNINERIVKIPFSTDWVKRDEPVPVGTKELLVGATNRPESAVPGLRRDDYTIAFSGERLVICGGSGESTLAAAQLFTTYFIDDETGTLLVPTEVEYRITGKYLCDSLTLNGTEIWEYTMVTKDKAYTDAFNRLVSEMTGYTPGKDGKEWILQNTLSDTRCTLSMQGDTPVLECGGDFTPDVAIRWLGLLLSTQTGLDNAKTGQSLTLGLDKDYSFTPEDLAAIEPVYVWVSPEGNDENDGSETSPLATLEGAKMKVREIASAHLGAITVNIRGGEYRLTETIAFDASDSGIVGAPVTWCAYNGEDVRLYGGTRVDASLITPADPAVAARVLDKTAAAALMQMDISTLVDKIPGFYRFEDTSDQAKQGVEVYIGGKALERSRWPNDVEGEAFLRTGETVRLADGSVDVSFGKNVAERMADWAPEAFADLHLFGFLAWDWTNDDYQVYDVDLTKRTLNLKGSPQTSYFNSIGADNAVKNPRYYLYNLVEEIDVPGESYIDRENRIVYFYPTAEADYSDVFVSTLFGNMFSFTDTKHVNIEGIKFLYTRSTPIAATGVSYFNLTNCEFGHTSNGAASLNGTHMTVDGCHVFDTARGGFSISGGDRSTLTPGYNVVKNCEIHGISRAGATYTPGIGGSSVGLRIANNVFYNCVHEMIAVGSNDILIEYNEFYDCVLESADMGAIYFGRDPSLMGTVIRYNWFHDIGNPYGGIGQQSIFIDDGNNGAEIYGNVFDRGTYDSAAIKTHGAQFSRMTGNIFVDMPSCYYNADWGGGSDDGQTRWFLWLYDKYDNGGHAIVNKITGNKFDSEPWRTGYDGTLWGQVYDYVDSEKIAAYADLTRDELLVLSETDAPRRSNILSGNIVVDVDALFTGGNCTNEENYITDDTGIFKAYGTDFTLTEAALAEVRKVIPNFENIPFDKIGIGKGE